MNKAFTTLYEVYNKADYQLLLCGGAVRDMCNNTKPKDYDFATDATPEETLALFKDTEWNVIETGIEHGTVTLYHYDFPASYEITTFRYDENCDGRHAEVKYTNNVYVDASRRDFTFNAMYMSHLGELIDPYEGLKDLRDKKVVFVGDPERRIREDSLRLLRYVRMLCKFSGGEYDKASMKAVKKYASLIAEVSVERVWQEFTKVFEDNPENASCFLAICQELDISYTLGLPVLKNSRILNLSTHTIEAYPSIVMACLYGNSRNYTKFCKAYKLSNHEKEFGLDFLYLTQDYTQDSFNSSVVTDLVYEGMHVDIIEAACEYFHNKHLVEHMDHIQSTMKPFPISGLDLKEIGYVEGQELGNALKHLKYLWKTSRYTFTKKQLLERIDVK